MHGYVSEAGSVTPTYAGYSSLSIMFGIGPLEIMSNGTTMPEDATDVAVLRIVVSEAVDTDLANSLPEDLAEAASRFEAYPPPQPSAAGGFAH